MTASAPIVGRPPPRHPGVAVPNPVPVQTTEPRFYYRSRPVSGISGIKTLRAASKEKTKWLSSRLSSAARALGFKFLCDTRICPARGFSDVCIPRNSPTQARSGPDLHVCVSTRSGEQLFHPGMLSGCSEDRSCGGSGSWCP